MLGEHPEADLAVARPRSAPVDIEAVGAASDRALRAWTVAWEEGRRRVLAAGRARHRRGPGVRRRRDVPPSRRAAASEGRVGGDCVRRGDPIRVSGRRRRLGLTDPRPATQTDRPSRATMIRPTIVSHQGGAAAPMRRAPAAVLLALLLTVVAGLLPAVAPGPAAARGPRPGGRPRRGRHRDLDRCPVHRRPRGGTRPRRRRHHGGQPEAQQGHRRHDHPLLLRRRQPGRPARGADRPRHAGREPIQVDVAKRKGYRLVTVLFRENLYFGETARIRLTFDLPGGEPRSESDVRVGSAFATFMAWAFGDRGSVRVEVPKGFRVEISGEDMDQEADAKGLQVWTATTTRSARLVRVGQRDQRRGADPRPAGPRGRRRGGDPWLAGGRALARPRPDLLRDGVPDAGGPDRARLAGGRGAHHLRGAHAAARGLRGLLRSRDGRDHDQRGPRRPHDRPRGVARLVQQVAVHGALDHRGPRRRVRGARPAGAGPRLPGAAGVEPPRRRPRSRSRLAAAGRDPRRGERGPRGLRLRRVAGPSCAGS